MRPMPSNHPIPAAGHRKYPAISIPGTALQVCVDYADVLAHTLKINRPLFERFIIVTAPHDIETQEICRDYDIELVVTERFWHDGAFFNKAAGLNEGLRRASTDLVCSVDADTILPPAVLHHVACISDRESLYGMARKIHLTYADYLTETGEIRATAPGYTIGFCQLFWRSSAFFPGEFEESYLTAAHYDIEFMAHWPASRRLHLGNLVASHIGPRQINWFGRHAQASPSNLTTTQAITDARAAYDRFIGKITALHSSRQLLIQNVGSRPGTNVVIDVCSESDRAQICLGEIRGGGFVEVPINLTGTSAKATLHWSDSSGERCCGEVPINFR
ncbi:MAG: hypothetical protein V7641_3724 [Blastocatellia bacterium]